MLIRISRGGVVIIYREKNKRFGAIENFVPDNELRELIARVGTQGNRLSDIVFAGRSALKFNDLFLKKYPQSINDRLKSIKAKAKTGRSNESLAPNEEYEIKSSSFDVLSYAFLPDRIDFDRNKYYRLLGLTGSGREYRLIEKKYVSPRYEANNIDKYKVFLPKASGSGIFGEILAAPVVGRPGESSTPTFISIGSFDSEEEAFNLVSYIKTKFFRALLGILKVTQDIVPAKFKYIPVVDFSKKSDIDWGRTVSEIDDQLFSKYKFDSNLKAFINNRVLEMK